MRQVGFVHRVVDKTYCFIRMQGEPNDRWAHKSDFKKDPKAFREGQWVEFTPIPMDNPPTNPPVTDVVGLQLAA